MTAGQHARPFPHSHFQGPPTPPVPGFAALDAILVKLPGETAVRISIHAAGPCNWITEYRPTAAAYPPIDKYGGCF